MTVRTTSPLARSGSLRSMERAGMSLVSGDLRPYLRKGERPPELLSGGYFVKYVMISFRAFAALGMTLLMSSGCNPFWRHDPVFIIQPEQARTDTSRVLPLLPAEAIVVERAAPPVVVDTGRRISVRAIDADARALLGGIAREAGINLLVSTDIARRVTLTLTDVPAMLAIREIALAANLTIESPQTAVRPSIVYYQLPVNINEASAETIAVRFGV